MFGVRRNTTIRHTAVQTEQMSFRSESLIPACRIITADQRIREIRSKYPRAYAHLYNNGERWGNILEMSDEELRELDKWCKATGKSTELVAKTITVG